MYQDPDQNYENNQAPLTENNHIPFERQPFPWDYDAPYRQPAPKKKEKKSMSAGKVVALALCCSILGGILGFGGSILANYLTNDGETIFSKPETTEIQEGVRQETTININEIDTSKVMTAAEVYAKNVNSTVGITTSITTNFWGYQTTSAASGSGFVLTKDGYILTNFHVIESSSAITVSMYNGESYDAELVGYDESNDIAVLKVNAENLTPVVLGDSDKLNVGDDVVAIGNPLGELTFSLTKGAVSAMDRQVTMSTGVTMNLIQTDCAINSGNSGGALFNMYGEVIGITNAKYSTSSSSEASIDNIGFAIPINHVYNIVTSIIEKGYIAKPYIGVSVNDVSADAQRYGLPMGASVVGVVDGSPAAESGLAINDIITEVNGTAITGSSDLVSIIGKAEVGESLTLKVYRQGAYMDITLTVGEQIQSAMENESASSQQQQQQQNNNDYYYNFPWGSLIPGF